MGMGRERRAFRERLRSHQDRLNFHGIHDCPGRDGRSVSRRGRPVSGERHRLKDRTGGLEAAKYARGTASVRPIHLRHLRKSFMFQ